MDSRLKQRLIGAAVLVALAVIFLPMLVKGPAPDSGVSDLSLRVPEAPTSAFRTVDLPLVTPAQAPEAGALGAPTGDDGALPTVDTGAVEADGDVAGPAAAEPLPPTVAGGDYVVHYGSFATAADAQAVLRQLAQAQLTGYAEAHTLNGRAAQRVRLGPYATRAEAEVVRLRAASLREDVSPRVVALDAERTPPAAPAPSATAGTPAPPPATPGPAPSQPAAPPPVQAATPPRAEPAAPPPAAAPGVGFVVQLGAFSKAEDATALRDRLRAQGITAFTDTVDTDKGRLTRVKAGPVVDRAEAERLKSQVKARVGIDGLVRQHP
jgi:cell division septation protein DedD